MSCYVGKVTERLEYERKTQGKNERDMEGKEKGRKEAVETNVVHSGLFDTK